MLLRLAGSTASRVLASAFTLLLAATSADAQCRVWSEGFARPGFGTTLTDVESFDGHLFAVGGRIGHNNLARWNGRLWNDVELAPGLGQVSRLRAGVVAGNSSLFVIQFTFNGPNAIMSWDGSSWTTIGVCDGAIQCLEILDDGTGPALYLGGTMTHVDGVLAPQVAKWDGTAWSGFGAGFAPLGVRGLVIHDDGQGPQLFAGTHEWYAPSAIMRFTGGSWRPVGTLTHAQAWTLASWDFGAGPRLYAATTSGLVAWDGAAWSSPTPGATSCADLRVADFGGGPQLYISGNFTSIGGVAAAGVASFDGSNFAPLGSGLLSTQALGPPAPSPCAFREVRWNGKHQLWCLSGTLTEAGGLGTDKAAAWDGSGWSVFGRGFDFGVTALARFDFGAGERLLALGSFNTAGGAADPLPGSAQWDGTRWRRVESFGKRLYAATMADVGAGAHLYIAGEIAQPAYNGLVDWDGNNWSGVGGGLHGEGRALLEHDDGTGERLFAGGNFALATAGPGNRIAAWNGTAWDALGGGTNDIVAALARHDEGSGAMLFAGGTFTSAGSVSANHIARWDGTSWSALGTGLANGGVNALCSFDDGTGAQLYAGGTFTNAGGAPASFLARWNGAAWSNVPGGGANGAVFALHVYDDGRGPALYAGGGFSSIGGITAYNLARFDGKHWEPVDGGLENVVNTITSVDDDGDGIRDLFVGGAFEQTGSVASGRIARLRGCPHYASFCAGDGSLTDHSTACPCGNLGVAGHGCANSANASGALLAASGSTQLDTVVLDASGMPTSAFGLYLQHDAQDDRTFHDGVLCAGGTLTRLRARVSSGGASQFPDATFAQDTTTSLSIRGGVTIGSGVTRYYSAFYRNASTTFCPPATANVTNGVRVIW